MNDEKLVLIIGAGATVAEVPQTSNNLPPLDKGFFSHSLSNPSKLKYLYFLLIKACQIFDCSSIPFDYSQKKSLLTYKIDDIEDFIIIIKSIS